MHVLVLTYLCFGAALAVGTLAIPVLRHGMARVASRLGMPMIYARTLWLIATTIAWPVGFYVFATGRLVLPTKESLTVGGSPMARPTESVPHDYSVLQRTDPER